MKILALESSATAASVALCEDETLLAQAFLHTGLTHSQTLLPMARDLLKACGLTPAQVDLIAVAAGPGSFTGLRIGVATAKGLAWAAEKPCAGCSTLASMAWNLAGFFRPGVAMDARRHQIYNARFQVDGTQPHRLTPDRAIALEDLVAELQGTQSPSWWWGTALSCATMPSPQPASPPNWRPPTSASKAPGGWPGRGLPGPGGPDLPAGPAGPRLPPPLPGRRERLASGEGRPSPTEPMTEKGRHGTMDEMVHVLDHPLLQHKLSILRDETTGVKDFREIVNEVATLMCYEATRDLPSRT